MVKYPVFILVVLLLFSNCFGDTFRHRRTGESFNGYVTSRKRGNKIHVRIEKKSPKYLNLSDYQIQRNYLGRKNVVYLFSIKDPISLIYETDIFEQAIVLAANQGPLFILIDIDTPGGRIDLAQRISEAIIKADNCTTVAFIGGSKFGGAFSEGAIIALACDKVYMRRGTDIGAAPPALYTLSGPETVEQVYDQTVDARARSQWQSFSSEIAERNNRPDLLVNAMVDSNIKVVEVVEDGERSLIDPKNKDKNQTIVRTLSEKGSLLILTAADAVRYGIADAVAASQEQLLADLAAAEARLVRNKKGIRAKRKFERTQRTFNRIVSSIDEREQRATFLINEIEKIDAEIFRLDELIMRNLLYGVISERDPDRWRLSGVEVFQWEDMLRYGDALRNELIIVLQDLMRNYNRAIPIAQENPDLRHHVGTLQSSLESAQATYNRFLARPRFSFPP